MDFCHMVAVRRKVDHMKKELISLRVEAQKDESSLVEVKQKLKTAQNELIKMTQDASEIEKELDSSYTKLQTLTDHLIIAEKKRDFGEQTCTLLERRKMINDEILKKLEEELLDLQDRNMEFEEKYEAQVTKNMEAEVVFEREENRSVELEIKAKDLEHDINELASGQRLLETCENQTGGRLVIKEVKIETVMRDTSGITENAEKSEQEVTDSVKLIAEKEKELTAAREEYHKTKQEMEFLILDICNK